MKKNKREDNTQTIKLPNDTFDKLVELCEFEDNSVETNWIQIGSVIFTRE